MDYTRGRNREEQSKCVHFTDSKLYTSLYKKKRVRTRRGNEAMRVWWLSSTHLSPNKSYENHNVISLTAGGVRNEHS